MGPGRERFLLYGAPGCGSAIVEALLAWCEADYRVETLQDFDRPGPARDRLLAVNPLAQVPTLLLPDATVMTESVAIALLLAERYPARGLAPGPGAAFRPRFLRRLVWIAAALYATFGYSDYPERWVERDVALLKHRHDRHREALWRSWEAAIAAGEWDTGVPFSALHAFVTVMTRWQPGREWFRRECPSLYRLALGAEALPQLRAVWVSNFPILADAAAAGPSNGGD